MVELKNKILEALKKCNSKMSFDAIKNYLSFDESEYDLLRCILDELELESKVYVNDCEEYIIFPKDNQMVVGEIRLDYKQRPFILSGERLLFIPDNCLHGAITGDIVLIKRTKFTKMEHDPLVVKKIIKRQKGELIFECKSKDNKLVLVPFNHPFKVPLKLSRSDEERLVEGSRMLVGVSQNCKNGIYDAEIISVVGHKNDPHLDIKTIASSYGIRVEFPPDVLKELEDIPTYVSENEVEMRVATGGRDLRNKTIFTIDGKRTKDIDDAISLEINDKGNYVLGVHIADVSYYVKEGSALQKEALRRGTSVYLVNSVIPMFPHKISSGICSLLPNVDRMAMSCEMEFDKSGKLINYEIFDSVINSKKKMVYEEINDIFDKGGSLGSYEPFYSPLNNMFELSDILSKKKDSRGYLNFGDNETRVIVDQNGVPSSVRLVERGISEKLIENFMIASNEIIGSYPADTFIKYVGLPYVYRTHGRPNVDALKRVIEYLQNSGYRIKNVNTQNSYAIQEIMKSLSELEEFPILSEILIRGLARASYSTHNLGHFGLGLENYTHFTSPIRRYPDLQTHYNIRNYSEENLMNLDIDNENKKMREVCELTSRSERVSDEAERAVNQYKMAELMEGKIGQIFDGRITYISRNGMSVRTTEHVTGSLSIQDLNDLGYSLDRETCSKLINEINGDVLRLGDSVNITVKAANKETRRIYFDLNVSIQKKPKIYTKKIKKAG